MHAEAPSGILGDAQPFNYNLLALLFQTAHALLLRTMEDN
jgi:hypothetical protein